MAAMRTLERLSKMRDAFRTEDESPLWRMESMLQNVLAALEGNDETAVLDSRIWLILQVYSPTGTRRVSPRCK